MKRALDIVISLAALVLLSPILLLAAFAVALESGRPILFGQTRVGLGGREFRMFKFRSMVRNAESLGPQYTRDNDDRVTRVGRVLRRSSVDELPQLLNVLAGDMSLVGPRPALPSQRGLYAAEEWQARCSVRPGITGLAQALLRSSGSLQECTVLDLRYAREASLALDLKIIARTVAMLLQGHGN